MVAAVELEKDAIAHEMSNQGNATQHQSAEFWGNGSGPTALQLLCFALHNL